MYSKVEGTCYIAGVPVRNPQPSENGGLTYTFPADKIESRKLKQWLDSTYPSRWRVMVRSPIGTIGTGYLEYRRTGRPGKLKSTSGQERRLLRDGR